MHNLQLDTTAILTATIDLDALLHNCNLIKSIQPQAQMVAVVKANGYGMGMIPIAHVLQDQVAGVAVSRFEEAIELYNSNFKKTILILEGFFDLNSCLIGLEYKFATVIHCPEQLTILKEAVALADCKDYPLQFWLKLETGMNRLGVFPELAVGLYQQIKEICPNAIITLCSHMSSADSNPEFTLQQYRVFRSVAEQLPEAATSISASPSLLFHPELENDYVRTGLALYGIKLAPTPANLIPVMTLNTKILSVKAIKKGEFVGYDNTWQAPRDTVLGVIGLGYADGFSYPRREINKTPLLVNGRLVNIVGKISMDMTVVDLGPDSQDKMGDVVEIFGKNLLLEDMVCNETPKYLMTTQLTKRVQRIYINIPDHLKDSDIFIA